MNMEAQIEFWKKDALAAWNKCEERRLENEKLEVQLEQVQALTEDKHNHDTILVWEVRSALALKPMRQAQNADIEQIAKFIRDHAYVDRVGGPYHAAKKIIEYFNSGDK